MRYSLADEWKQAWKWLTVQLAAIVAVAPEAYEQVGTMQKYVSESMFHHIMAALGLLVILNTIKKKTSAP